MILQEGRYYRARNGGVYGPLIRGVKSATFFDNSSGKLWLEDGFVRVGSKSKFDLIAQLTTLEANPPAPSPDATPKVDRVVLASKILPRLAPDLAPSMAARQALQYADAFLKEISNGND